MTTGEFRTLAASYQDVKGIRGPIIVKTTSSAEPEEPAVEETGAAADGDTAIGGGTLDEATKLAAEVKPVDASSAPRPLTRSSRDGDVRVDSIDELVEFFTAAGKKGVGDQPLQGAR